MNDQEVDAFFEVLGGQRPPDGGAAARSASQLRELAQFDHAWREAFEIDAPSSEQNTSVFSGSVPVAPARKDNALGGWQWVKGLWESSSSWLVPAGVACSVAVLSFLVVQHEPKTDDTAAVVAQVPTVGTSVLMARDPKHQTELLVHELTNAGVVVESTQVKDGSWLLKMNPSNEAARTKLNEVFERMKIDRPKGDALTELLIERQMTDEAPEGSPKEDD